MFGERASRFFGYFRLSFSVVKLGSHSYCEEALDR